MAFAHIRYSICMISFCIRPQTHTGLILIREWGNPCLPIPYSKPDLCVCLAPYSPDAITR